MAATSSEDAPAPLNNRIGASPDAIGGASADVRGFLDFVHPLAARKPQTPRKTYSVRVRISTLSDVPDVV